MVAKVGVGEMSFPFSCARDPVRRRRVGSTERRLRKFCGPSISFRWVAVGFSFAVDPRFTYLQLQVLEGERHSRLNISSYYPFSANQLCSCVYVRGQGGKEWNLLPSESKLSR